MFSAGLLYASLSAFFNGSFGLLAKTAPVHPIVFNYWMAEGCATAGVLALAVQPWVFTPWGLLSGLLFVIAAACSLLAIRNLGLSVASGLWCGMAVLTSFSYGVVFAGDRLENPTLAGAALLLLLAGLAGITAAGHLAGSSEASTPLEYEPLSEQPAGDQEQEDSASLPRFSLGCTAAVAAGMFGGLVLAPMLAAPPNARGIPYIPSMALGVFITAPLVTTLLSYLAGTANPLKASTATAWAGIAAGVLWQAGNACSILAVQDPHVGLAVAYPIMQCGLLIAGAWGILLFKEMEGGIPRALYWASGAVLVGGAALLSACR